MKKFVLTLFIILTTLVFGACSSTKFDGSKTGDASQLNMEYEILNTTESQTLELLEGDKVNFTITSESGKLSILLKKEDDEPIYEGADIPTGSFQVSIEESGSYDVSVTGENAKGSVSILKAVIN